MSSSSQPVEWDYELFTDYQRILIVEIATVLSRIRSFPNEIPSLTEDTRPVHCNFFSKLVPAEHSYFAGHYRGENYPALINYCVMVEGDPRVGCPPNLVFNVMNSQLLPLIQSVFLRLNSKNISNLTAQQRLYLCAHLSCIVFELFLRIHPYANGNGHIGRFIVQSIMGYLGFWPTNGHWTIEPKPRLRAQYTQCIIDFRNGNPTPLIAFILQGYL